MPKASQRIPSRNFYFSYDFYLYTWTDRDGTLRMITPNKTVMCNLKLHSDSWFFLEKLKLTAFKKQFPRLFIFQTFFFQLSTEKFSLIDHNCWEMFFFSLFFMLIDHNGIAGDESIYSSNKCRSEINQNFLMIAVIMNGMSAILRLNSLLWECAEKKRFF